MASAVNLSRSRCRARTTDAAAPGVAHATAPGVAHATAPGGRNSDSFWRNVTNCCKQCLHLVELGLQAAHGLVQLRRLVVLLHLQDGLGCPEDPQAVKLLRGVVEGGQLPGEGQHLAHLQQLHEDLRPQLQGAHPGVDLLVVVLVAEHADVHVHHEDREEAAHDSEEELEAEVVKAAALRVLDFAFDCAVAVRQIKFDLGVLAFQLPEVEVAQEGQAEDLDRHGHKVDVPRDGEDEVGVDAATPADREEEEEAPRVATEHCVEGGQHRVPEQPRAHEGEHELQPPGEHHRCEQGRVRLYEVAVLVVIMSPNVPVGIREVLGTEAQQHEEREDLDEGRRQAPVGKGLKEAKPPTEQADGTRRVECGPQHARASQGHHHHEQPGLQVHMFDEIAGEVEDFAVMRRAAVRGDKRQVCDEGDVASPVDAKLHAAVLPGLAYNAVHKDVVKRTVAGLDEGVEHED
mmetsp:Transcript_109535/g.342735  ORF Transcript_109535/g.342735 Transcript_109535/m.342735 type:complete len:460 (-) Transcript_109535:108-1487(-)